MNPTPNPCGWCGSDKPACTIPGNGLANLPRLRGKLKTRMALQTDDCDIRDVRFYMSHGGNGDYYITLTEYPEAAAPKSVNMRIAMSGGGAPHKVKMAVAQLFRAMEEAGLNNHPKNDETTTPAPVAG